MQYTVTRTQIKLIGEIIPFAIGLSMVLIVHHNVNSPPRIAKAKLNTELLYYISGGVNVVVSYPGKAGKSINEIMRDRGCVQNMYKVRDDSLAQQILGKHLGTDFLQRKWG